MESNIYGKITENVSTFSQLRAQYNTILFKQAASSANAGPVWTWFLYFNGKGDSASPGSVCHVL